MHTTMHIVKTFNLVLSTFVQSLRFTFIQRFHGIFLLLLELLNSMS